MGKIVETLLTRFDGGMVIDARDNDASVSQLIKHFDHFTKNHALIPYKDSEATFTTQADNQLRNFLMYGGDIYGLGVVSGSGKASIYKGTPIDNPSWTQPNNAYDASGATSFELFIEYHGIFYGAAGGTRIWSYNIGTGTFTATAYNLTTYSTICQGLVHTDDILYVPYDNKIAKNDNGNWSLALTLPENFIITSICQYGSYVAIACKSNEAGGSSRVFLWNRDDSVAEVTQSYDLGVVDVAIIKELDGYLIAVSNVTGVSTSFQSKVVFSRLFGNTFQTFKEFIIESGSGASNGQKYNNRLYFILDGTSVGGTTDDLTGVWSLGRNPSTGSYTINFDRLPANDTIVATVNGFFVIQDFFFISYIVGTTYYLSKTNDQSVYTGASVLETQKLTLGDSSLRKKLIGVTVMTQPLKNAEQVVLKYRIDGESTWTTIFTQLSDSDSGDANYVNYLSVSHSAINIESSGATLPIYKEIQFRIESTGGAIITGLKFKEEIQDKDLY